MYCSKECQVDAWKNKNHKVQCKYLAGANDIGEGLFEHDEIIHVNFSLL